MYDNIWLVVWLPFFFPLILGCDYHPNWRTHLFQVGVASQPPTSGCWSTICQKSMSPQIREPRQLAARVFSFWWNFPNIFGGDVAGQYVYTIVTLHMYTCCLSVHTYIYIYDSYIQDAPCMEYLSFTHKCRVWSYLQRMCCSDQPCNVDSITYNVRPLRPPLAIAKLVHSSVNYGLYSRTQWQPSPCNLYWACFFSFLGNVMSMSMNISMKSYLLYRKGITHLFLINVNIIWYSWSLAFSPRTFRRIKFLFAIHLQTLDQTRQLQDKMFPNMYAYKLLGYIYTICIYTHHHTYVWYIIYVLFILDGP